MTALTRTPEVRLPVPQAEARAAADLWSEPALIAPADLPDAAQLGTVLAFFPVALMLGTFLLKFL